MRRQHNGAILRDLLDQVTDLHDLVRVQTVRRLVQNNELGVVDDGLRYTHALLITAREVTDQTFVEMTDPALAHNLLHGRRYLAVRDMTQARAILQVLRHRQIRVQGRRLG